MEPRGSGRAHAARAGAEIVVKIGGSLLARPAQLRAVLETVRDAAHARRLVVVPGGGPFADAVREADRRLALTSSAAHWMAVLAMDQHAHLLASRTPGAALVATHSDVDGALGAGLLPVLAPYAWLRAADPLPHSWEVTSDSIAAWLAGALGAARVVLVKPPGARAEEAADPYFPRALPSAVTHALVPADRIDLLTLALRNGGGHEPPAN